MPSLTKTASSLYNKDMTISSSMKAEFDKDSYAFVDYVDKPENKFSVKFKPYQAQSIKDALEKVKEAAKKTGAIQMITAQAPTKHHYEYMKQDDVYMMHPAMFGMKYGSNPCAELFDPRCKELAERAQRAVTSFLKGKPEEVRTTRTEKLAHYKPANFSRPKLVPPFMPTHDELSELVAEFAQKEVDSNGDK